MKNREFTAHGVKYCIVDSNNADFKWQAMSFDTGYNAWVRTMYYANTQAELKEIVKEENLYWLSTEENGEIDSIYGTEKDAIELAEELAEEYKTTVYINLGEDIIGCV